MSAWERRKPDVTPGGDSGGDAQVSDSWDARWRRQLADGLWALVTRSFYAASDAPHDFGAPATHIEYNTEYLVCTDPRNPGDTEVWADSRYTTAPCTSRRPDANDARRAAEAASAPTEDEWLGNAPRAAREWAS